MSLEAIIWVFGAEHSGSLLRSHQPSVMATLVPLVELQSTFLQESVLCLFICMCPRVSWTPLVSIV